MSQIFIRGIQNETLLWDLMSLSELIEKYSQSLNIPPSLLKLSQKSRPIQTLDPSSTVEISLKVLGGKGSFGTMLKGQGIMVRVENFESCRDLYGRRIRDVNNEIRMNEWKKKQEEAKKDEKELSNIELPIKRKKKVDKEYKSAVEKRASSVRSALADGLKRSKLSEQ